MEPWYIYLPSLTLKIFLFTETKNFFYKISVTTVNFELNKLLLILLIIRKHSENYISFYLIIIAAENISEDRKIIANLH